MYAAVPGDIHLPRRRLDTHKGDYGRALIIAGSTGYTGAPALAARAASKMGTGLVSLGVPKSIYNILAVKLDEEMPFPLPDDNNGRLVGNAASEILRRAKQSDVCLIGPGLGISDDISELVQSIVRISETPIVIDADGLNAIAGNIDILNQATCPLILTPHTGEFERLGGKLADTSTIAGDDYYNPEEFSINDNFDTDGDYTAEDSINPGKHADHGGMLDDSFLDDDFFDDDIFDDNSYDEIIISDSMINSNNDPLDDPIIPIQHKKPRRVKSNPTDRLRAAREFASKHGCILVLKGHRTIVALPNGVAYVNTTGGPAMAKGGTGDVLAGMIAALIAQKLPIVHAVASAVYIHGLVGDMCAAEYGDYSVLASDLIAMLPRAINEIEKV